MNTLPIRIPICAHVTSCIRPFPPLFLPTLQAGEIRPMGAGTSRTGLPPNLSRLPRSRPRSRRSSIARTLSSLFVCGASTQMDDYQAEYLVDSAELDNQGKLESTTKESDGANTKTLNNESASASYTYCPSSTEIVILEADDNMSSSTVSGGSSQAYETLSNSNALCSPGLVGPSSSSEVSSENDVSEEIDSYSECSSTSSDSSGGLNFLRGNNVQEVGTSAPELQDLERLRNSRESRWSGIRLIRDPSSRRNHWRITGSISFDVSNNDSDELGPSGSQNHGSSDDFSNDERQREVILRWSSSQGSQEQRQNQESEIQGAVDGAEELVAEAGLTGALLLAEALLQVLDRMNQQPMMTSLPTTTSPAPVSVVDNFPVKIYSKADCISEGASDVCQCYVCLDEYEEGDKIRVLPCNHEYHMSCVDKWLKEVHGVCPLCRAKVCEGLTTACDTDSDSDDDNNEVSS